MGFFMNFQHHIYPVVQPDIDDGIYAFLFHHVHTQVLMAFSRVGRGWWREVTFAVSPVITRHAFLGAGRQ